MNTQLKILLYLLLVGGMLYYIQYRYELFDISLDKALLINDGGEKENTLELLNSEGKRVYVDVEVADTEELRAQGLSNREELGDYQGMLFVFESKGAYPFWMKDMHIALDLIYIDETFYIVDILEGLLPCTEDECVSFLPSEPFKYVLEVNSGFSKLNKINIGNAVIFDISSEE